MADNITDLLMGLGRRTALGGGNNGLARQLLGTSGAQTEKTPVTIAAFEDDNSGNYPQPKANNYRGISDYLLSRGGIIPGIAGILLKYKENKLDNENALLAKDERAREKAAAIAREDAIAARNRGYAVEDRDAEFEHDLSKLGATQEYDWSKTLFGATQSEKQQRRELENELAKMGRAQEYAEKLASDKHFTDERLLRLKAQLEGSKDPMERANNALFDALIKDGKPEEAQRFAANPENYDIVKPGWFGGKIGIKAKNAPKQLHGYTIEVVE